MMLVDLAKEGFMKLTGVDYSEKAINLARKVLNDKGLPEIKLQVYNILDAEHLKSKSEFINFEFKLAHDKGTYDAISLCPDNANEKRNSYILNVWTILSEKGFLVLTSCNWTKDELIEHFNDRE